MMITTALDATGAGAPAIPVREDGQPWQFALITAESQIFADSCTEIIEGLVPGYTALSDDDALIARYEYAIILANLHQQLLAGSTEGFDPGAETENVLTAIFTPREEVNLASLLPAGADGAPVWNHAVPLVLPTVLYSPFTSVPAPVGDIAWIDPSNERAFLESLDTLGVNAFLVNPDA